MKQGDGRLQTIGPEGAVGAGREDDVILTIGRDRDQGDPAPDAIVDRDQVRIHARVFERSPQPFAVRVAADLAGQRH